jgi:hypothetical protein
MPLVLQNGTCMPMHVSGDKPMVGVPFRVTIAP